MRALHGLLTLFAAILVIVFAGSWIGEHFGIASGLGLKETSNSGQKNESQYIYGVPVGAYLEVSTDLAELLRESGWDAADGDPMHLPVFAGRQSKRNYLFWSSSGRGEVRWKMGGGCRQGFSGLAVNFLRWDAKAGTLDTFFRERVLLSLYGTYKSPKGEYLVALVVRHDTDGDGFLTCKDRARFEVISLTTGDRKILDREFIPDQLAWHGLVGNSESLGFTETRSAEDAPYLQLHELNILNGILTERDELKVLSEAAVAANRDSDGNDID
ncbi:MAG: hypothetical protein DHS20C05_07010 [Hyphococcus sp.]|nr:MAG: hypothetical protein DHS20C05_07010 [Marinicaulis sp.]